MDSSKEQVSFLKPKAANLDDILSRLEFGLYQKYLLMISGITLLADGMEMTLIALLTQVL